MTGGERSLMIRRLVWLGFLALSLVLIILPVRFSHWSIYVCPGFASAVPPVRRCGLFSLFFVFTLLRKQTVRNILEQSGPVRRTNTAKSISTPHVDDTMAHTKLTFRMSRAQFAEGKERLLGPWLQKKTNSSTSSRTSRLGNRRAHSKYKTFKIERPLQGEFVLVRRICPPFI